MKTQAAILVSQNKELIVDEVEVPSLGPGKVLVEIKATRICGSQLGEIDGVKGPDDYLPHLLGHEAGGIVREVGPLVTRVREGEHVVCHWRPAPGISGPCPTYDWKGTQVNAGHITTFNQHSIISESRLTPIEPKYGHEVSALMADTITTGFGIISNDAKVRIGQSVCIIGVGGIGLGAVLGAKLAGANPIVAVDLFDHKLEQAKKCGATHCVNQSEVALEDALCDILGKAEVDVMIEGTGNPKVIERAYELTSKEGTCVLFGVIRFDQKVSLNTLPLHFGRTLTGSEGGQSQPHLDIPRYTQMMDEGVFHLDDFVSHRCKLEDVNSAISRMRSGESTHTLITF
ncbi:MAG: zinc-binding dehydrogenase [Verrucomicrobia bacterium]|jgi:S-(hydroxymethyl)glutathione dehydrogenase/alcohol dehydrogenase|nr:zinc-binding dehydrogenase [Verrucomicrobiota bacterium]MDA0723691.1 zinc-binding dehydrogenase [Verrucomicrobiota bacterium]MDA1046608.1 zinc-binding dehydrogenase [Verrucomicrobiota bacterium]